MTIKLLNSLEFANKGKIIKRFFIVYKKYNYLGEVFYCVKNRRIIKKYDGRKVMYLEKKTGTRVFFDESKILSDKQFKNRIRDMVASTQKLWLAENLHEVINKKLKGAEK